MSDEKERELTTGERLKLITRQDVKLRIDLSQHFPHSYMCLIDRNENLSSSM